MYRLVNDCWKKNESLFEVFHLGTGRATSVLKIIEGFVKITEQKINYRIGSHRDGDAAAVFTETAKTKNILG